jgi:Spy/CpxP family protein refolding chaperone
MSLITKKKVVFYLTGIFVAGTIAGVVTTYGLIAQRSDSLPEQEKIVNRLRDRLQSRLDLTPAQVGKIEPLMAEACSDFHRAGRRCMRQSSKTLSNLLKEISVYLTEDQLSELERFEAERRELWQRKCRDWENKSDQPEEE